MLQNIYICPYRQHFFQPRLRRHCLACDDKTALQSSLLEVYFQSLHKDREDKSPHTVHQKRFHLLGLWLACSFWHSWYEQSNSVWTQKQIKDETELKHVNDLYIKRCLRFTELYGRQRSKPERKFITAESVSSNLLAFKSLSLLTFYKVICSLDFSFKVRSTCMDQQWEFNSETANLQSELRCDSRRENGRKGWLGYEINSTPSEQDNASLVYHHRF